MFRWFITLAAGLIFLGAAAGFAATAASISPQQASAMIKERPALYLLDVRTLQEYQEAHLADAHLIPIDQIEHRLAEIPNDRPILVYCAVGSRSAQVFNYLARRGYAEIYNLDGGITAWVQHGYPIVR